MEYANLSGDGVSDIDINKLVRFHIHGKTVSQVFIQVAALVNLRKR